MAINYLATLIAAIAGFAVGAIWYGPLFGKKWMKMMGYDKRSMKSMKMTPAKSMSLGFLSTLVSAGVLALFLGYTGSTTLTSSLKVGALLWLGFLATKDLGTVLWENRSWNLFFFNAAYDFVSLLVMSSVLSAFV